VPGAVLTVDQPVSADRTLNPDGTVDTGYTGTVHFTSSDPQAVLPKGHTFTAANAGTTTFSNAFILKKKGNQTITVTDTEDTALTGTITIDVT
jgi:hypothetical protein